jgi:uncharacterized protein DUF4380
MGSSLQLGCWCLVSVTVACGGAGTDESNGTDRLGSAGAGSTADGPGGSVSPIEGVNVVNGPLSDARLGPAPALENGRYVFRAGELELEVDPAVGGRVTRLSLAGTNVLTGPEVVAGGDGALPNMYGSTFWTSPQSDWGWPPEVAIDSAAQRAEVTGGVLSLTSEPGESTGYAVRKQIALDAARGQVLLDYELLNRRAARAAAPWEISRVPKEGLVFFPAAAAPLEQSTLQPELLDGVAWIEISQAPAGDSKLFQDGSEGWLAYVYRDLVFIKSFEQIAAADQAPGEAEIEIFVSGSHAYVEIEQQGRYALPASGEASRWRVAWLLRRLPPELAARRGDAGLVNWVRALVSSAR